MTNAWEELGPHVSFDLLVLWPWIVVQFFHEVVAGYFNMQVPSSLYVSWLVISTYFNIQVPTSLYVSWLVISTYRCRAQYMRFRYMFYMFHLFVIWVSSDVVKVDLILQLLYMCVASVCFKCFSYFRGILLVFYLNVIYVAMPINICYTIMFPMFHMFRMYVNVLSKCCICCSAYIYVLHEHFPMFHIFWTYIIKCFIYFEHIL